MVDIPYWPRLLDAPKAAAYLGISATTFRAGVGRVWPRELELELVCEGDHGLFGPPRLVADCPGHAWETARDHGWQVTSLTVLCPDCR